MFPYERGEVTGGSRGEDVIHGNNVTNSFVARRLALCGEYRPIR